MANSCGCPKCGDGTMRPRTTFDCNWVCDLCGYVEYHAVPRMHHYSKYRTGTSSYSSSYDTEDAPVNDYSNITASDWKVQKRVRKELRKAKWDRRLGPLYRIMIVILSIIIILKLITRI